MVTFICKLNLAAEQHLGVGTSVVDDDVGHCFYAIVVKSAQAVPQLPLRPVLAVQVVQVPRQVALCANSVAGRGQPEGGDACIRQLLGLAQQLLQEASSIFNFFVVLNKEGRPSINICIAPGFLRVCSLQVGYAT